MGGRGGKSGKSPVSSTAGALPASTSAKKSSVSTSTDVKATGVGGSSSTTRNKAKGYTPSKTPVSKMSDKKLREELTKAAGHWYASGKSGISFGNHDPYLAAIALSNRKMSRSRMEKEYKSILKRLKEL